MDWFKISLLYICICFSYGAPQGEKEVKIVSQTNEITPEGGYKWSYEADNGIKAEETGSLKKTSDPENPEVIVAQGNFEYTDKEGNKIALTYVADDEGGFQPQGAHLPTSPPIPPNIQKALDWIKSQPSTTERSGRRK